VTVGIGYDVGAGVDNFDQLWSDWRGHIPDVMIADLVRAIGVTGLAANALAASLRSSVDIPWEAATAVYSKVTIPRYYAKAAKALPNFEELPADCKGALVSLVFNRGPSFSLTGDRYSEMRAIKAHMANRRFDRIPFELRKMARLWIGTSVEGVAHRREREAQLFEKGLMP
jgi:GH24 family phage-related lysozyme (muramidase)